jgi:hypothetical protein
MRKLILSVVVTLFLTTAFATEKPSNNPVALNETYKEIAKLLNNYSSFSGLDHEVVVKVRIAINENNEMVVLSTNSANEDLNYYIKNTLNYKKLSVEELGASKGFTFLVKFAKTTN